MSVDPGKREWLAKAIKETGRSLKEVSLALRRNAGYLHQFCVKGTPDHLPLTVAVGVARTCGFAEWPLLRDFCHPDEVAVLGSLARRGQPDDITLLGVPGVTFKGGLPSQLAPGLTATDLHTVSLAHYTQKPCYAVYYSRDHFAPSDAAAYLPKGALLVVSFVDLVKDHDLYLFYRDTDRRYGIARHDGGAMLFENAHKVLMVVFP